MFVIEDDFHAEQIGTYSSREEAEKALSRIAEVPWESEPNICPCGSETCHRVYHIIEFDDSSQPWRKLADEACLEVSATGVSWLSE